MSGTHFRVLGVKHRPIISEQSIFKIAIIDINKNIIHLHRFITFTLENCFA